MIKDIINIAQEAGGILLKYFKKNIAVKYKNENVYNKLTQADLESNEYISRKIKELFPSDELLIEESESNNINYSKPVWIIDPLDGTNSFVREENTFCVMIGLCIDGKPKLGVIYLPVLKELYFAENNKGAFMIKDNIKKRLNVSSISLLEESRGIVKTSDEGNKPFDQILRNIQMKEHLPRGSAGYNIIEVAKGKAELYINADFRASKWDVCAGQVILEEAGGKLTTLFGKPIDYKTKNNNLKKSFLASNKLVHNKVIRIYT